MTRFLLAWLVCSVVLAPIVGRGWDGRHDLARRLLLIAQERARQLTEEGYTTAHDAAEHPTGELAQAAWCYLDLVVVDGPALVPGEWPFGASAWKPTPTDPVRQLTKAAALIAAEIDRLLAVRATTPEEDVDEPDESPRVVDLMAALEASIAAAKAGRPLAGDA